jgi:hypothetical protein
MAGCSLKFRKGNAVATIKTDRPIPIIEHLQSLIAATDDQKIKAYLSMAIARQRKIGGQ